MPDVQSEIRKTVRSHARTGGATPRLAEETPSPETRKYLPLFVLAVARHVDDPGHILHAINHDPRHAWRGLWGRAFTAAEIRQGLKTLRDWRLIEDYPAAKPRPKRPAVAARNPGKGAASSQQQAASARKAARPPQPTKRLRITGFGDAVLADWKHPALDIIE